MKPIHKLIISEQKDWAIKFVTNFRMINTSKRYQRIELVK